VPPEELDDYFASLSPLRAVTCTLPQGGERRRKKALSPSSPRRSTHQDRAASAFGNPTKVRRGFVVMLLSQTEASLVGPYRASRAPVRPKPPGLLGELWRTGAALVDVPAYAEPSSIEAAAMAFKLVHANMTGRAQRRGRRRRRAIGGHHLLVSNHGETIEAADRAGHRAQGAPHSEARGRF
jgi:hypothetical protein